VVVCEKGGMREKFPILRAVWEETATLKPPNSLESLLKKRPSGPTRRVKNPAYLTYT
jgi:hypothetical protein